MLCMRWQDSQAQDVSPGDLSRYSSYFLNVIRVILIQKNDEEIKTKMDRLRWMVTQLEKLGLLMRACMWAKRWKKKCLWVHLRGFYQHSVSSTVFNMWHLIYDWCCLCWREKTLKLCVIDIRQHIMCQMLQLLKWNHVPTTLFTHSPAPDEFSEQQKKVCVAFSKLLLASYFMNYFYTQLFSLCLLIVFNELFGCLKCGLKTKQVIFLQNIKQDYSYF